MKLNALRESVNTSALASGVMTNILDPKSVVDHAKTASGKNHWYQKYAQTPTEPQKWGKFKK